MDTSRIESAIDVEKLRNAKVGVFGVGGAAGLVNNLTRCGVGKFVLWDPDTVTEANIARQEHSANRIGASKVDALAEMIFAINPAVHVQSIVARFDELSDAEIDLWAGDCDLFIFATDHFRAQARGNEVALRLGTPAVWVGLYPHGEAGEVIFWHSGIDACYCCLCPKRYAAHAKAAAAGRSLDPSSDGCTIFDVTHLDSIAGPISIGLLTRGSDNRFGRLIDKLGDRNFIQVQLSPDWTYAGRSIVREQLGVAADCPAFFSWNTIVRSDPDRGQLPCPDCERFRGHRFTTRDGRPVRIKGTEAGPDVPTAGVTLPPNCFH